MEVKVHKVARDKARLALLVRFQKQAESHMITHDENRLTDRDMDITKHWNDKPGWRVIYVNHGETRGVWAISDVIWRLWVDAGIAYQMEGLMYSHGRFRCQ